MANYYKNLPELIDNSIQVYNGMIVVWPQHSEEDTFNFECATFNGVYNSNNGTLAFILKGLLYVTPRTRLAKMLLEEAGLVQDGNLYVPFSNWDYPKKEKYRWHELKEQAEAIRRCEFAEDCENFCNEHNIAKELEPEILANCFRIPETGVPVKNIHFGYEQLLFPAITGALDSIAVRKLGTYSTNNGKVVFVYRNGSTYVTKGYKILYLLREAGYKEGDLFVPFSNWEEIQDPILKNQWDSVTKW